MIVDIYKINQILSVLVYPDSECIKIIKNNKVIREIKPLVSYGFNSTSFVFCDNLDIKLYSREFRIIYYPLVNNYQITYYLENKTILHKNIWIDSLYQDKLPKYVTKEQWNITDTKSIFIEKETIDDKIFQDSININKNIFINPYIIKNNNEEKIYVRKNFTRMNNVLEKTKYKMIDNWNNIQKYILNENDINTFMIEKYYGCYSCNFSTKGCTNCNNLNGIYHKSKFKYNTCNNCKTKWMFNDFISRHNICTNCDRYCQPNLANPLNKNIVLADIKKEFHKYVLFDEIVKERQKYIKNILSYELMKVVLHPNNRGKLWDFEHK